MTIVRTASFSSPLGWITLFWTPLGVCRLVLPGSAVASNGTWWRRWFDGVELLNEPLPEGWRQELEGYFRGKPRTPELPLDLRGTPFQKEIWSLLRQIPYGTTWTYAKLARRSSRPSAYRAVGAANGRNPVPILVPCHRVVTARGGLGGYSGGLSIKRRLLALEGACGVELGRSIS